MKLDKSLAFQVVNTIKDTCGQDINFIDKQGMIFASTNADRIGTFHTIGHKAAQTEQTIEVFSDDDFPGTQKGINMPLYYHGSFLAVIGITGEPDQVRQYVHLADRITHLLIREKELNRLSRSLDCLLYTSAKNRIRIIIQPLSALCQFYPGGNPVKQRTFQFIFQIFQYTAESLW